PQSADPREALESLLATPEFASKGWVWQQYDSTVRTNTAQGPGGDAAVLLLKGTPSGLGMTCDVNPVYCHLDPRRGGAQAVAEAVRNLACVGAEPVGLTDCLNFGNPERPEVSWEFRECVRGMSEACRALGVPVISGNVSFYNETEGRSIYPTPAVAMVGVIPRLAGPSPGSRARGTASSSSVRTARNSAVRPISGSSTASSRDARRRWTSRRSCASPSCCVRPSPGDGSAPRTTSPKAAC